MFIAPHILWLHSPSHCQASQSPHSSGFSGLFHSQSLPHRQASKVHSSSGFTIPPPSGFTVTPSSSVLTISQSSGFSVPSHLQSSQSPKSSVLTVSSSSVFTVPSILSLSSPPHPFLYYVSIFSVNLICVLRLGASVTSLCNSYKENSNIALSFSDMCGIGRPCKKSFISQSTSPTVDLYKSN